MRKELGDCFAVAGRLIMDFSPEEEKYACLVHGTVYSPNLNKRINHAWVEVGDVVFDKSNGHNVMCRKEKYYAVGKVKETKKYTPDEARKLMLKTGNFGNWKEAKKK